MSANLESRPLQLRIIISLKVYPRIERTFSGRIAILMDAVHVERHTQMRYILIAVLLMVTPNVFACSCEWGEYFYSMEKLEGITIEPEEYYRINYGVKESRTIHKGKLNPKVEDNAGFMVIVLPIPEEFRSHIFHFVLESKVTLEPEPNKEFVDKSTFQTTIFKPDSGILELQTRMTSKGNEWFLYILAFNDRGEIVASATHSGKNTCGKAVYVSSVARAKELDSKRISGCFQTWGYK